MRYTEIKIINEATLSVADFGKRNPEYWINLIELIEQGTPIPIDNGEVRIELKNPQAVADNLAEIWDGSDTATPEQIELIKKLDYTLSTTKKLQLVEFTKVLLSKAKRLITT